MTDEITYSTNVDTARHRLQVLANDTDSEMKRDLRRVAAIEHDSLRVVLNELHRANQVMRDQANRIAEYAQAEFLRKRKAAKK